MCYFLMIYLFKFMFLVGLRFELRTSGLRGCALNNETYSSFKLRLLLNIAE
jgi:hypothetical protein